MSPTLMSVAHGSPSRAHVWSAGLRSSRSRPSPKPARSGCYGSGSPTAVVATSARWLPRDCSWSLSSAQGQHDQIEVMYAQNTPTRTPLVVWTCAVERHDTSVLHESERPRNLAEW